ncbi:DHHC palmitoyltransferase-domain-containing protein [Bombardia bombarda]|uniref:Palmitoyltransferase n=1 Tax=Bombardia bombarda TaxID=252184 RepID=A0AA39WD41_9PEZI|nr:DHHC palmitoyltransferase-domain-containing protein [Bombardia bombarda]
MTDIGTDDGVDMEAQRGSAGQSRSGFYSDIQSRPGTARTGVSSSRSPWSQAPLRKGISAKRQSGSGSIGGSSMGTRPPSSASKSHIPSLTSHAFFRPMSSQKLQAQRGVWRPAPLGRPLVPAPNGSGDETLSTGLHSLVFSQGAGIGIRHQSIDEGDMHLPPSRGTEMTGPDTVGRMTANTSPTHGHHGTSSLTDSLRPLQRQQQQDGRNLTINVDKGYGGENVPTPSRTPRSFRSSFLIPSRHESGQNRSNREIQGGEKLDSAASSPQLPPMNHRVLRPTVAKEKMESKLGYNYQYFEGNTVFCLGGRAQNTRYKPMNIVTGSLVVLPAILFCVFSAPWIWYNISPAVPIIFGYVSYICISSFIHASASDPGILPRNLHRFPPPDENEDPLRLGPPTNDWTLVKSAEKFTAAMEVPIKYCKTCQIWRPPRAHHCRVCDNCVETQDHHCVWINNCVGRRNYRYFVTFLGTATFLSLYLSGACLAQIIVYSRQQEISMSAAVDHFRVPLAMVIYGFLCSLYPAALLVYHIFLIARGETTREYLNSHKFLKKDRYRAFTQGSWFKNWLVAVCRPRPPTYYSFKGRYVQGDQRFGTSRRQTSRNGTSRPAADSEEGIELHEINRQQQKQQLPRTGFMGPAALRKHTPTGNAPAQDV